MRDSYDKFKERFQIIELNDITDIKFVIQKFNLSYFVNKN